MKRILVFAVSFMMIVSSASVFAAEELTGIDVKEEGAPAKKVEERSPKKELKASDKKELESKEIIELLKTTTRSFDEIKAFLKGENPEEEE